MKKTTVSPEYSTQLWSDKLAALEARILRLEQACWEKEFTINQLRSSLVALTEENILLRAKVSNFSDTKELSLGIEQINELLHTSKELSGPFTSPNSFPEIEELQLQLEAKKTQYAQERKESIPPVVLPETPASRKKLARVRARQVRKHRKTRYIPSYLRVPRPVKF